MQGRCEVTAGRCLSASLGSLGTDYGDDSQEKIARERESDRRERTKEERKKKGTLAKTIISKMPSACV